MDLSYRIFFRSWTSFQCVFVWHRRLGRPVHVRTWVQVNNERFLCLQGIRLVGRGLFTILTIALAKCENPSTLPLAKEKFAGENNGKWYRIIST